MRIRQDLPRPAAVVDGIGPLEACPSCGHGQFVVEEPRWWVAFRCLGCSRIWRYELGHVWELDPTSAAAPQEPTSRRAG